MPCSNTVHRQPRSQHWQLIKRFPLPNLIRRALQSRLRDSRRTSPRLPLCEARPTSRLATGSSRSLTRPQTDAESQQYPRYPAKQSIQPSSHSKQSNQHWQNQWIGSSISVFPVYRFDLPSFTRHTYLGILKAARRIINPPSSDFCSFIILLPIS